jgi:hypothetical protein
MIHLLLFLWCLLFQCHLPQQLDQGRHHHLKWSSHLQWGKCLNQASRWISSSRLVGGRVQWNCQQGQISNLCLLQFVIWHMNANLICLNMDMMGCKDLDIIHKLNGISTANYVENF